MPSDFIKMIPIGSLPYPGTCRYCGSNQRPCVDFGINTEYDGAILICRDCFLVEVVKVEELGLIPVDQVENLQKTNADMMLKIAAMDLLKEKLRDDLVGAIDSYGGAVADSARDVVSVSGESQVISEKLF